MKKRFSFSMLAAIAGLVMAFTFSAFNTIPAKNANAKWSNVYFQYGGADELNATLTNHANWIEIPSLPGSNPCTAGSAVVCVSHLDATTLASQAGADDVAKFITYISNNGFATYVNAVHDFQKR